MKGRQISNIPEYAETVRIHNNGDTYSLEIQEYEYRRAGFATYDDAFSAALAEVERRKVLANQEVLSYGMANIVNTLEYQRRNLESLERQVVSQYDKIVENEARLADLERQYSSPQPISNDDISDGDPSELADDEKRMREGMEYWFTRGARTIAMRMTDRDYDRVRDGDPDHVIVTYFTRQPDLDFETE